MLTASSMRMVFAKTAKTKSTKNALDAQIDSRAMNATEGSLRTIECVSSAQTVSVKIVRHALLEGAQIANLDFS